MDIDAASTDQLNAWNGDEGSYWAANAERFDRSIAALYQCLRGAAAVTENDRVLDIGCGTGQMTRDAARAATSGEALGVDLSSPMLDYARTQAVTEGVTNVSFVQADAQMHRFEPASFDVAMSRMGAMFFPDFDAAFSNIGRALRPGGRLVLVTWQPFDGNEWIREIRNALSAGRDIPEPPEHPPSPFALARAERLSSLLTGAGFTDVDVEPVEAPMWFGDDADDAHQFVLGQMSWMVRDLDEAARTRALDALRSLFAAHETADGVTLRAAAWLTSATR